MNFDIIFFAQNYICSLIEVIFSVIMVYALIKDKPSHFFPFITKVIMFCFVFATFSYYQVDHILYRFLPFITYVVLYKFLTRKNIIHCLYITLIVYTFVFILQFAIITVLPITAILQDAFAIQLLGNSLTLILCLIVVRFMPIHHIYDFMVRKDTAFRFFLLNTFTIVLLFNYLVIAHLSDFIYYFLIIIAAVTLLVFFNVELLRSRVILDRQKNIINNYNKYLPIVDELIEQVRTRQHNYENEIQSLTALVASCEDYESLKTEFQKNIDYASDSDLPTYLLRFNLKLLSGLLFQKYSAAHKKNIHMKFDISTYNIQSDVPEYVIVEAVGILMDNAIEASGEDNTIYVTIDSKDNRLHFSIMNVGPELTPELLHNMFKKGYTTKDHTGQNSGIGLHQLREISIKHHGRIQVDNIDCDEQQYLSFTISL